MVDTCRFMKPPRHQLSPFQSPRNSPVQLKFQGFGQEFPKTQNPLPEDKATRELARTMNLNFTMNVSFPTAAPGNNNGTLPVVVAPAATGKGRRVKKRKKGCDYVEETLAKWKAYNHQNDDDCVLLLSEEASSGTEKGAMVRKRPPAKGSRKGCMKGKGGPENSGCRYRGVRQRTWGRWVAEIREPVLSSLSLANGKATNRLWLGTFSTSVEAAIAYDDASRTMYGPLARVNFPCPTNDASSSSAESVGLCCWSGNDVSRKTVEENMDSSAFFVVDSSSDMDRLAADHVSGQDFFIGTSKNQISGDCVSVDCRTRSDSDACELVADDEHALNLEELLEKLDGATDCNSSLNFASNDTGDETSSPLPSLEPQFRIECSHTKAELPTRSGAAEELAKVMESSATVNSTHRLDGSILNPPADVDAVDPALPMTIKDSEEQRPAFSGRELMKDNAFDYLRPDYDFGLVEEQDFWLNLWLPSSSPAFIWEE